MVGFCGCGVLLVFVSVVVFGDGFCLVDRLCCLIWCSLFAGNCGLLPWLTVYCGCCDFSVWICFGCSGLVGATCGLFVVFNIALLVVLMVRLWLDGGCEVLWFVWM